MQNRNHQKRNGTNCGYAAGKSIKSVDQIDGICQADNPYQCNRDREPAKLYISSEDVDMFNDNSLRNNNERRKNLTAQLDKRI